MVSCICTRGHLGFALGDPVAEPAEATKVAPIAELAPMGPPLFFGLMFVIAWMGTGLLTAFVLGRHGHDRRSNGALGFVFGPLFVPLAMEAMKRRHEAEPVVVAPGRAGEGPVDVLVVLDGPPAEAPAALPVLDMLGPRLGRVTLARVVDFESMHDERERADAGLELSCASLFLCQYDPALVLLAGTPSEASRSYAAEAGYHLVVRVEVDRGRRVRRRSRRSARAVPDVSELVVAESPDRR